MFWFQKEMKSDEEENEKGSQRESIAGHQPGQSLFIFKADKISKKNEFSVWRLAIAFLYLLLSHSLHRLTSFLHQTKNQYFL